MSQIYRYDFIVPHEALDINGHVNNVEYVRWMQEAAIAESNSRGRTKYTRNTGATWVVRAHRIKYLRPAFAGEHISVLTWVVKITRAQSLRKYKFVRLEDNAVLTEGETDWVFVDAQTGKPRSIPKEIVALFEVLPEIQEAEALQQFGVRQK